MKSGLVLGGEALWQQVRAAVGSKTGLEELAWTKEVDRPQRREQVLALTASETDEWVKMWARVRLGGERKAEVAREVGYANGSSVLYAVRQLEQRIQHDNGRREKLRRLSKHFE